MKRSVLLAELQNRQSMEQLPLEIDLGGFEGIKGNILNHVQELLAQIELPPGMEFQRVSGRFVFEKRDKQGNLLPGANAFLLWPQGRGPKEVAAIFSPSFSTTMGVSGLDGSRIANIRKNENG